MKTMRLFAALPLFLAACTSTGASPGLPPAEFTPIAGNDGVLVWSAGADAWFADPKDHALHAALSILDTRLVELPEEISQPDFPIEALQLALDVIASPMSLRIALEQQAAPGALPFRAQLTVDSRAGDTSEAMAERLSAILTRYGVPSLGQAQAMHGLQVVPLGPISAYHGALGNQLVIAVNDVKTDTPALGSLDLPAGVKPFFAFKIDYGQIGDAMAQAARIAAASAGQDGGDVDLASMMWIKGTTAQGGMGFGPDRLYGSNRTQKFVSSARQNGLMPSGPLSARDIALVPSDATWAALGRVNPDGFVELIRKGIQAQMKAHEGAGDIDPFEMLENFTGFDVQVDLFDNLGQTVGAYTSDTTGGGGWTSLVVFAAVTNEKKLRETLAWAESEINGAAAAHAKGYVALRVQHPGGQHVTTLTFPGLPVPLELSYALADGYVFFALSPQALVAAIQQAKSGKDDLSDNARFGELAGQHLDDLYSISFVDTPRLTRDGYSLVNMGCAAIVNALRSKSDSTREPGMIMPSYHEIENGAKAFVQVARIAGDDMVVTWQADRSMLVNACGVSGLIGGVSGVSAILAPVFILPKIKEAKHAAEAREALELEDALDTEEAMEGQEEIEETGDDDTPPVPENDPK